MESPEQIVAFYAHLHDPANPSRGFAWHLDTVKMVTGQDGTIFQREKQYNVAAATAAGFTLPIVLDKLNVALASERLELETKLAEAQAKIEDTLNKVAEAEKVALHFQDQAAQSSGRIDELQALAAQAIADKQAAYEREAALLKEIEELTDTEVPSVWERIKAVFVP